MKTILTLVTVALLARGVNAQTNTNAISIAPPGIGDLTTLIDTNSTNIIPACGLRTSTPRASPSFTKIQPTWAAEL